MELTKLQLNIIDDPDTSRLLVTAGAGTGKTLVLVHRLAKLVSQGRLAAGSEVLLLTFTRAARGELKRRVEEMTGPIRFVRATTFDSFVTRQLEEMDPEGPWKTKGYDERIAAFTEILERLEENQFPLTKRVRHIFIDEIQDLVGIRANMIKQLLVQTDCGFTLLGDPAQGIYNFQEEGEARRLRGRSERV